MHLNLLTSKAQRLTGQKNLGEHLSIIFFQISGESRTNFAFHKPLPDQVVGKT